MIAPVMETSGRSAGGWSLLAGFISGLLVLATLNDMAGGGTIAFGFILAVAGALAAAIEEAWYLIRLRSPRLWVHLALLANLVVVVWWLLIFQNFLETT
jgi:hypothetical protein